MRILPSPYANPHLLMTEDQSAAAKKLIGFYIDALKACVMCRSELSMWAQELFKFETEQGVSVEFTFDKIYDSHLGSNINKGLLVLTEFNYLLLQHKAKSGQSLKHKKESQVRNTQQMIKFMETGIYNS